MADATKHKIVHLTSVHSTSDVRIFHRECKSLARANYEVSLIAPHDRDELIEGVRIKAVPKPRGRLERMTRTVWRIYRESIRQKAEVYHFHDPELIGVGLLLRAQAKNVIYDIHENIPKSILNKYYLPKWLRPMVAWLARRMEHAACRRFSALVPAAPSIEERVRAFNPKVVTIRNFPLSEDMCPPTTKPWRTRASAVAYVGGIERRRGILEMTEAMSLLPSDLNARLKLAGPFIPEALRDEVACLRGWNRVDALGVLDRAGVVRLLGEVQAGLVLIQHPWTRFKPGYPTKMFEYMAMGIPVIASNCSAWREIIDGNGCGLLVDPRSPEAIAEAIWQLLSHPEKAEAMGRRGREAVESRYNWGDERRKLMALYAEMLGDQNSVASAPSEGSQYSCEEYSGPAANRAC